MLPHATCRKTVVALTTLSALAAILAFAAVPARAAGRCAPYTFIGARGSGESSKTMGAAVEAEWKTLKESLGSAVNISSINVPYDASPVVHDYRILGHKFTFLDFQSAAYSSSVAGGVGAIAGLASRCKSSKLILAGHSQGAHAIMLALPLLDQRRVLAVTLFGDPMFHADSYASRGDFDADRNGLAAIPHVSPYPSGLKGRLFDYCHAHDPVCQGFIHCYRSSTFTVHCDTDLSAHTHSTYPGEDTDSAAANVARLIRDDQAAQGHPLPDPPPASKGPVDVAFAIDTTGSMDPIISSVSADVQAMAAQLASTEPDYRLALVAYRDAPPACDDDYQALTVQDFTTDTAAFNAGVASLIAEGGCDTAESVFSGVMQGLALGWRPEATKALIAIGDAEGHSPDPGTGYVAGDVIRRAQASSIAIYGLDGGAAAATLSELANATGGQVLGTENSDQVPLAIQQAISAQAAAPSADAGGGGGIGGIAMTRRASAALTGSGYGGPVGAPITLSAARSWSPLGRALTYGWDFESDGVVDQVSDQPVIAHTWAASFDGDVTLHVTDSAGLTSVTQAHVTVSGTAVAPPAKPHKPRLTLKGRSVRATWRRGHGGGNIVAWVMRSGRGAVIAYLAPRKGRTQTFNIRRLPKGKPFRLRISAVNASGESAQSAASSPVKPRA